MPSNWRARATWPRASSTKWRARSLTTSRSISRARNRRCATHRDLRKRDRRAAVGDQFRRHRRNGSGQGADPGRQRPVRPGPRHSRQGRRGHRARGGGAPRTLRREYNRAPPPRTQHRACGLRRRRRGGRNSEARALNSRGERADGREVPQRGSADVPRIRPRSRQPCASRRGDCEQLALAASDDERGARATISATRLRCSASGRAGRRGLRRRSQFFVRHWRKGRASGLPSAGR